MDSARPTISAEKPIADPPTHAVTRTPEPLPHRAITPSSTAVASSAHPTTSAGAPAAHAQNSSGHWASTTAAGNGRRSLPSASPYAAHSTASTADATAVKPSPSVSGAATAWTA